MDIDLMFKILVITQFHIQEASSTFKLLILHNNDMRCNIDETAELGKVFGGMARVSQVVKNARKAAFEKRAAPVLYLNAGDTYTDPVWQNPFAKRVAIEFMNILKPDVACFGYHDLEHGVENIQSFIQRIKFPIVAANIHFRNESYLSNFIKPYVILNVNGVRIGVVGYITPAAHVLPPNIDVYLENEIEALNRECKKLKDLEVTLIIALGHSGFTMDLKIAEEVEHVDIVIGGLTNRFLWNGAPPHTERSQGPYPTQIIQSSGKKVLVVSTYGFTKYMGNLSVTYNADAGLISYEGNPIFLDINVPYDPVIEHLMDLYGARIRSVQGNDIVLGTTRVYMDADNVRYEESNFGNFILDAFVEYMAKKTDGLYWTDAAIGLMNSGAIRKSLQTSKQNPNITKKMLTEALPFRQRLIVVNFLGASLLEVLEISVASNGETRGGEFLQMSGIYVTFNMMNPPLRRVAYAKVFCTRCEYPTLHYVDPNRHYKVIVNAYLANGGDGHVTFRKDALSVEPMDAYEVDVIIEALQFHKQIRPERDDRITFLTRTRREIMHLKHPKSCFSRNEYSLMYITFSFVLLFKFE